MPHYTIWHLYEPSLDDIRHMEEMENERKALELEEKTKKERLEKIQSQFDDTADQWENDKNLILSEEKEQQALVDKEALSDKEVVSDKKAVLDKEAVSDKQALSNNEEVSDKQALSNKEAISDRDAAVARQAAKAALAAKGQPANAAGVKKLAVAEDSVTGKKALKADTDP